jgi:hypothetical protein
MDEHPERRRFPRISLRLPVSIVTSLGAETRESAEGTTVNISRDGMCLETDFKAPVASLVFLSVEYAGRDSLLLGEVVWRTEGSARHTYGLRIRHWTFLDAALDSAMAANRARPSQIRIDPPAKDKDQALAMCAR